MHNVGELSQYCLKLIALIMVDGFTFKEGQAVLATCLFLSREIDQNPEYDENKLADLAHTVMLKELAKIHN